MSSPENPSRSKDELRGEIAALKKERRFLEADSLALKAQTIFAEDTIWIVERAWIAFDAKDFLKSIELWRSLRRDDLANHVSHCLGEGAACHRAGRFPEADLAYLEAKNRFPPHKDILVNYAWNGEVLGDLAEMCCRWEDVKANFPKVPEAYIRLSSLAARSGHPEESERILKEGMIELPDHPQLHIDYAWNARRRGDLQEALKRWEVVKTRFPERPEGYWVTARILMDLNRVDDADLLLAPSLRLFPENQHILEINGWSATCRKAIQKADEIWAKFRELFPNETAGYLGWIGLLRSEGRLTEAEAMLAQANERFPNNKYVLTEWAQILTDRRDWEVARELWQAACTAFPQAGEVHHGLIRTLISLDRREEARHALLTAENDVKPDLIFEATNLRLSSSLFDTEALFERGQALIDRYSDKPQAYVAFAEVLRLLGSRDRAELVLRKALERFPENFDLEIQYAQTLGDHRNWSAALPLLVELKKRAPSNGHLRHLIASQLWQARQDQSLMFLSGQADSEIFFIPPDLEDGMQDAEQNDLRDLFMKFESLGITCEFGMVQRRFGAEPLNLLRWTTAEPHELTAAIENALDGVGDPENTIIEITHGEYTTRDSRYYLFAHTFIMASSEPLEEFSVQQCKRLQYLSRKFMDDLKSNKKIYVYAAEPNDTLTDEQANRLYDALHGHSPNVRLLCVRPSDDESCWGEVMKIREGLFFGYIDKVSTVDISFDRWVSLCRSLIQ